MKSVLGNTNYLKLLSAQIIAACGDRIHQMALLNFVILVSSSTNTTKHLADITFWGIIPTVVLGPIAMTLVDRWPWKSIMACSTGLRCLLAFSMPWLLSSFKDIHTAWGTAFLLGTFAAVFAPCRLAIMPNLVPRHALTTANAISSQVGNIATILALPLGGYLVNRIGRDEAFFVDGATFMAAGLLILMLRPALVQPAPRPAAQSVLGHLKSELRVGMRYLRDHHDIRFVILFYGFLNLVSAILYVCILSYSIEILRVEERGIGQLLGVMGTGMALGAIFLVWKPRLGEISGLPYAGLAGAGGFIWLMSQGGSSHAVALFLLGVGFCGILALVPNDTYLHRHVPDAVRGRVFVVRGILQGVVWLFSMQFVKSIVHHLGLVQVLAWLGISAIAMALFFAFLAPSQSPRNQ